MTPGIRVPERGELPELSLPPGTLILGDVHLDLARETEVERFCAWLAAVEAPALIVLGDLFEYWIGAAHARTPGGQAVLSAFSARTQAGTALHLIPGNRDFLLGEDFARASGVQLHPRGLILLTESGQRCVVLHGDELCTRDLAYQRLRRVLRSGPVLGLVRRLPRAVADRIARRLRGASKRAVAAKPAPEKALQEDACRAWAGALGCAALICGHAHEHRDEHLPEGPRWLVVDAFGGDLDGICLTSEGGLAPCRARMGSERA